jgi:hypothetical protein
VLIPSAVEQLHETNAPFGKAWRQQTVGGKCPRLSPTVRPLQSIPLCVFGRLQQTGNSTISGVVRHGSRHRTRKPVLDWSTSK